jgi:hypothetical protein
MLIIRRNVNVGGKKVGYITTDIIFPTAIIKNTYQLTTYPSHDGRRGIRTINKKGFTSQQITLTKHFQKNTKYIHNLYNSPLYDDMEQINVRYHHYYLF